MPQLYLHHKHSTIVEREKYIISSNYLTFKEAGFFFIFFFFRRPREQLVSRAERTCEPNSPYARLFAREAFFFFFFFFG